MADKWIAEGMDERRWADEKQPDGVSNARLIGNATDPNTAGRRTLRCIQALSNSPCAGIQLQPLIGKATAFGQRGAAMQIRPRLLHRKLLHPEDLTAGQRGSACKRARTAEQPDAGTGSSMEIEAQPADRGLVN